MESFNIIGDVGGNFSTLMRLIAKMPSDAKVVLLGDLIDRGPKSKKVVKYARDNKDNVVCLLGNHEHMMIDFVLAESDKHIYHREDWLINGGGPTIRSYFPGVAHTEIILSRIREVLKDDAEWMQTLPLAMVSEGLIVTHAPLSVPLAALNSGTGFDKLNVLWNRRPPIMTPGMFQVHGHNGRENVRWYKDLAGKTIFGDLAKPLGVNIDTSKSNVLTGIHWPSKDIFQQEYID